MALVRGLFFLVLAAVPGYADVQASPTDISLRSRRGLAYPWYSTTPPPDTAIAITGSGDWNITLGGGLSTACGNAYGYCFNVVKEIRTIANGKPVSGRGEDTVYLTWKGLGAQELPAGQHTGTVTIGATTINVTLDVVQRNAYDAFVYQPGFPKGCVNSNSGFPHADTCTITDERPTSNAFQIPAVGDRYVDPQFGYEVTRITPSGFVNQYGAVTAFSANGKYLLAATLTGSVNAFDRETASITYANIPGININSAAWDPVDDEKLWFYAGAKVFYRTLDSGTTTLAADFSSKSGNRPKFNGITMGGTLDITDDGWWAFMEGDVACALNLNDLSVDTQESKTFCTNFKAFGLNNVDFPQITQVDSESGQRYVVLIGAPRGLVFSVGEDGLNYEYPLLLPGAQPHSDVGQDEDGRQIFFWSFPDIYGNVTYLATMRLNKGADMLHPVEAGGGLRLLYPSDPGDFNTDGHYGCTWRGVCVFTPYGNSGGIEAKKITATTPGDSCGIISQGHGYATDGSIVIGGANGITDINGVFRVTVTGPNTYTLNGQSCSSGYVAGTANSAKNVVTAPNKPNRQEIVMVRPGQEVRRLAIHRAKLYGNGTDMLSYYQSPRSSVSRDGRFVAFASNQGIPEQPSVYIVDAGAPMAGTRIDVTGADATATKVVLNYSVPAGEGPAKIRISATPDLMNPVVDAADTSQDELRQFIASDLQENTEYFYRIHSGRYSKTGQFRTVTAAAMAGETIWNIDSEAGEPVQQGTDAARGTSPLKVKRGIHYVKSGNRVKAVVVR